MDILVRVGGVFSYFESLTTQLHNRGFIYFALFLWRSVATDQPDEKSIPSPNEAYGPRAFTTLLFVIGVAYSVMIIRTAANRWDL